MRGAARCICKPMSEFEIIRLGHQGDGIAAGPVFAALTLPGEIVSGTLEGTRLNDVRIVTPSEGRVRPPCRHFKSCGGCQLQHAKDDFVASWKVDVVRHALAAQGLDAEFRSVITSPERSRRRASFSVRRTKKAALAGFHGRASGAIVEIPDCHLLQKELLGAVEIAKSLAMLAGSRKGEMSVTATTSNAGLDIAVSGGKPLDGSLRMALGQEAERFGLARLSWDSELAAQREPPTQTFGRAQVVPPFGAFLQATHEGEAALLVCISEIVGDAADVIDLFSGCGTFSIPLAENAQVHAVEGDADMVAAMDAGWRRAQGLKRLTHEARDLFRRPLQPDELKKFGAVVLDPPRAGAEAQVAELAKSGIGKIAYVSCNPVSFARDIKTLHDAGYEVDWVQVVDQFRWSSHVELVARLTLKSA